MHRLGWFLGVQNFKFQYFFFLGGGGGDWVFFLFVGGWGVYGALNQTNDF